MQTVWASQQWAASTPSGPTLGALSLDDTLVLAGVPVTINILGATTGSTITGTVPAGLTLNSGARTITGTPTAVGVNNFDLIETLAGSPNSPRTNPVTLTVEYNPQSALFGAGEQGAWYDFSDLSTLFQDTAGTNPVTAVGQRIARVNDKSGNNNHATRATTAQQPILRQTAGGLYYAEFDGTDDSWVTGTFNLSATDEMTVIAGMQKLSDAAIAIIVELGAAVTAVNGSFSMSAPVSTAAANFGFSSRGTATVNLLTPNSFAAPNTSVLTGLAEISVPVVQLRVNGVQSVISGNTQGTGNYSSVELLNIGRRASATRHFNGQLYGLIIRGKNTTGTSLSDAENYMAGKTGVTL